MRKKRTELKTRRAALKAALRKAQTGQSADERKAEREAKQAEKTAERKAAREAKKAEKETAKKAAKAEKPAYDPVQPVRFDSLQTSCCHRKLLLLRYPVCDQSGYNNNPRHYSQCGLSKHHLFLNHP